MKDQFVFSPEVKDALQHGQAVVALESTIISHGMPYPQNLEVAHEVQQTVRDYGAVPATICIMKGVVHIGLDDAQLEQFAELRNVVKCSRRDLPYVISRKLDGGTTVASTMMFATMSGIEVFATGGIGGVHRGVESTLDISADLPEFALSPVTVVSAGAKAILDLPRTVEYLETCGVPVIGYQTDEFPAFYTRSSGIRIPMRLDDAPAVADFIRANRALGMKGILVANPIPEQSALDQAMIEDAIREAVKEADHQNILGKELTPFLLKRLHEVTAGASQKANRELVLNNARVGTEIARALARA